jgi:hypothetical protein
LQLTLLSLAVFHERQLDAGHTEITNTPSAKHVRAPQFCDISLLEGEWQLKEGEFVTRFGKRLSLPVGQEAEEGGEGHALEGGGGGEEGRGAWLWEVPWKDGVDVISRAASSREQYYVDVDAASSWGPRHESHVFSSSSSFAGVLLWRGACLSPVS